MNQQQQKEQVSTLLDDLDAGVFAQRISRALSDVALGVSNTGKKGEVSLSFKLERIGDSNQVKCVHTVKYSKPTDKGKVTEDHATITPLHVGVGGKLTLFPESQPRLFDDERAGRSRDDVRARDDAEH